LNPKKTKEAVLLFHLTSLKVTLVFPSVNYITYFENCVIIACLKTLNFIHWFQVTTGRHLMILEDGTKQRIVSSLNEKRFFPFTGHQGYPAK
jgi:hypothetical protein